MGNDAPFWFPVECDEAALKRVFEEAEGAGYKVEIRKSDGNICMVSGGGILFRTDKSRLNADKAHEWRITAEMAYEYFKAEKKLKAEESIRENIFTPEAIKLLESQGGKFIDPDYTRDRENPKLTVHCRRFCVPGTGHNKLSDTSVSKGWCWYECDGFTFFSRDEGKWQKTWAAPFPCIEPEDAKHFFEVTLAPGNGARLAEDANAIRRGYKRAIQTLQDVISGPEKGTVEAFTAKDPTVAPGFFYALTRLYEELDQFNQRRTATEEDAERSWHLRFMDAKRDLPFIMKPPPDRPLEACDMDPERDVPEHGSGEWAPPSVVPATDSELSNLAHSIDTSPGDDIAKAAAPLVEQHTPVLTKESPPVQQSVNAARNAFQAYADNRNAQVTVVRGFRTDIWNGNAAKALCELAGKPISFPVTGTYVWDGKRLYGPAEADGIDKAVFPVVSFVEAMKRLIDVFDGVPSEKKTDTVSVKSEPEYREPTKWDLCKANLKVYVDVDGNWLLGGIEGWDDGEFLCRSNATETQEQAIEWLPASHVRIPVDDADREWQFKCKLFDLIADHAQELNSRCFTAPFEDEATGRQYSLSLEWINRLAPKAA